MIIETSDRNQIYYLINRLDRQRQMIKNIKVELSEETDIFKKDIFSLLNNEAWASAVPSYLIFSSAEELKLRASVILDKFFPNVKDKFFLDYGCGDGLVVEEAKRRGAEAHGYDLGGKLNNVRYDYILLYDVLDHAIETSHKDILSQIASVSHQETILKVRVHPWTSRHGSHAYKFLNKAFIHLIFTDQELLNLGYCKKNIPTVEIMDPVKHYEGLFAATGWKIVKSLGVFDEVENFFSEHEEIKKRLTIPKEILRISFIDYELKR